MFKKSSRETEALLQKNPNSSVFDVVHLGGGSPALASFVSTETTLKRTPQFLVVEERAPQFLVVDLSYNTASNPRLASVKRHSDLESAARVITKGGRSLERTFTRVEVAPKGSSWPARFKLTTDRGETVYANELEVAKDPDIAQSASGKLFERAMRGNRPQLRTTFRLQNSWE